MNKRLYSYIEITAPIGFIDVAVILILSKPASGS